MMPNCDQASAWLPWPEVACGDASAAGCRKMGR
jgi:hypothetical protein